MISLVDVLTRTEAFLRERGITSPRLEAELLLCHALEMERLQLYLAWDRPISDTERTELRALVGRRGNREPLSWILGSRGFHNIELAVHPQVLDPRPDTEVLVEAALKWIPAEDDPVYVADVGCGTGAVGLAIAAAHKGVRLYAVDLSPEAIANTKENVTRLGLESRVAVLHGSYLEPIPRNRPVEWVVSNPPYIPSRDIAGLMPEVSRWEPRLALDGGRDGLDPYRSLIPKAAERASRGVLVEVGQGQAARVADMMRRAGLTEVTTTDDLNKIPRVVGGLVPRPA